MMRIVPRDLELMRWMNTFGFVTIHQICRWLQVGKVTAYERVRKLVQRGLLVHERIFQNEPGVYRVSSMGVTACQSPLSALRRLSIATYQHSLCLVDLSFTLRKRWSGEFITERQLRQQSGQPNVGYQGHLNDGMFVLPHQRVAIEVELTQKSKARLSRIFEYHYHNPTVDETWYFCRDAAIQRSITAFAEKVNFIRVYSLKDFQEKPSDE